MIADRDKNCVYLAAMLQVRFPEVFVQIRQILTAHRIEVRLLDNVRDFWTKDFSPIQVGPRKLVKFRYEPDYLKNEPRLRTGNRVTRSFLDVGKCQKSTINLDGGNVVASRNKAILTEKIYKENRGINRADLRNQLRQLLRVDQLIMIPKEPFDHIGHADSMVRFVDEDTVLVNDYTKFDRPFGERLLKVLRRHKLKIETVPYYHEGLSRDGIPSAVGCFTNFLMTERVVIMPVYGTKDDHIALKKLESVFTGLPIVPLDGTDLAREGGIFNCIGATYHISQKTDRH